MKDIVLVGSGGFARETLQVILDINDLGDRWNVLGFLDDNEAVHGEELQGYPILGPLDWLTGRENLAVVVAVGSTVARNRLVQRMAAIGEVEYPVLIHPKAWIGRNVTIGEGTIICAGCMITTDIQIRRFNILNLDCTVGHDSVLNDFVTAAPSVNISGDVHIGEGCALGTGSAIIQGIQIGEWSILGAGAVTIRDIPANVTAVGAPASVINERESGWHLK